jgi:hypothetical protein
MKRIVCPDRDGREPRAIPVTDPGQQGLAKGPLLWSLITV